LVVLITSRFEQKPIEQKAASRKTVALACFLAVLPDQRSSA